MAQLAAGLQKTGATVTVSCLANVPGQRRGTETVNGIAVNRVPARGVGQSLRWPEALVPKGTADLVHFHGFSRLLLIRAWLDSRHIPFVITLHGGIQGVFTDSNRTRRSLKRAFDISAGRYVLNRASRIIALTTVEAEHLERSLAIRNSRIMVIPNAVAEASLRLYPVAQGESGRLLVLSRLATRKRVADLIEALATFACPIGCDIAGPDEGEGEHIKLLAKRLPAGTIRFLGPVVGDAKSRLLRAATALVLPSSWEGLSISGLEAIAQGTPVIASEAASTGLPKSACLTFPVGDIRALAARIESLSDKRTMVNLQEGVDRSRGDILGAEDHAKLTMQVYRELLSGYEP
jgi:glycosyltransferase involved in cell wall biosynthesis